MMNEAIEFYFESIEKDLAAIPQRREFIENVNLCTRKKRKRLVTLRKLQVFNSENQWVDPMNNIDDNIIDL